MNSYVNQFCKKIKASMAKKWSKKATIFEKEKVVKIELYVHDLRVGNPNATVYEVATASVTADSTTELGSVDVVDDLITAGPDIKSKAIGRIQGMTASADQAVKGVALILTVCFTTGRFKGSTISILGRNEVMEERREVAVAGGTGAFRFARGYAIQCTTSFDAATNYGVFKYTIYTTYDSKFDDINDVEIAQM